MPYIKQIERDSIDDSRTAQGPGQLNYLITDEITNYLSHHKLSYKTVNDILGALEGAKLEFYRRVAAPYEDKKIAENGDVY